MATLYVTRQFHTVQLYRSAPWVGGTAELDDMLHYPPVPLPCACQALASIDFNADDVHAFPNDLKPLPELSVRLYADGGFGIDFGYFTSTGATWEELDKAAVAPLLSICANEYNYCCRLPMGNLV